MAQFYTLDEAARVLGMGAEELKAKAQAREVRAFLDGGSWRFRAADIDELARRRGMGSDPDLALSDLDLLTENPAGHSAADDLNLSDFQLGVSDSAVRAPTAAPAAGDPGDSDVLLSDLNVPPGPVGGSSSTILGMGGSGKRPTDSDVRLVPDAGPGRQASDSDVRLAPHGGPSDSDVKLGPGSSAEVDLHSGGGSSSSHETTLQPSPFLGSSGEMPVHGAGAAPPGDSDFELTPSSVIDALQPDSGSDFELTALEDSSSDFETTPLVARPSDSDVTSAAPLDSGIDLGRPSDSGINLQSPGAVDLGRPDSIELAPMGDSSEAMPVTPKPRPTKAKADPGATALPVRSQDPSATALPMGGEKDIFEDTDFEVDALGEGDGSGTVQLEATSDFDLDDDDSGSGSEVFALDEDDVDERAATALVPGLPDAEDSSGEIAAEPSSGEIATDWSAATPSAPSAPAVAGPSPVLASTATAPEWGGVWVGLLMVSALIILLLVFVGIDVSRNLYEYKSDTPIGSGVARQLAGLFFGS